MSSHTGVMPRTADGGSGDARGRDRKEAKVKASKAAKPMREPGASRNGAASQSKSGMPALGGEPRVSLLPPEVNDAKHLRAARGRLIAAVFLVFVIVVAGTVGAFFLRVAAEASLNGARSAGESLTVEQQKYVKLQKIESGIALIQAGQQVGASTEIDWQKYLEKLQATLPAGVVIKTVSIESASPLVDYTQSTVPLEGSRVATLTFTATSPTLPTIPDWLDGLSELVGFADAVPGTVTLQDDGAYSVNITMHINSEAFALRYAEGSK